MPAPADARLRLQPHPTTPCPALDSLWVDLHWLPAGALALRYELRGALADLRLPAPSPAPAATDGLWRHSCLEAFVGAATGTAYVECNFSPSGDWACYAFDAERVRAAASPTGTPQITTEGSAHTLTLTATVPRSALAALPSDAPALLGLTAVIESTDGSLSYWALAHPQGVPDFHARAGWTARLPLA